MRHSVFPFATLFAFGLSAAGPVFAVSPGVAVSSPAHAKSRFAVIDPAYDPARLVPALDIRADAAPWLYGPAELECWRLQVLRKRVEEVKLKVGYPGVFHTASPRATFELAFEAGAPRPESFSLRAVGDVVVSFDDRELFRAAAAETPHLVTFPRDAAGVAGRLKVALVTSGEPPAIQIEAGPLATGSAPWRWSVADAGFETPQAFPATLSGLPPHRVDPGEVVFAPTAREAGLFDLGRVVLGRIAFAAEGRPRLFVGESTAEARNDDPRHFEQSTELVDRGDGTWISAHPLALRYFRIEGAEPSGVKCHAQFDPASYAGAFACSDERLTRVWMTAAYTLRLCRHDFLIDGVKRDRLPWVGDLAMSLMANAYVFGDGEIVRRSLVALGRAGISQAHLNGIVDYSMWWVVAQDLYQLYYADAAHLRREWPRIREALDILASRCDAEGLYLTAPGDWVFVDWVSEDKQTALQIVWWWAQTSAGALAERVGDAAQATRWRERAAALGDTLRRLAWDEQAGSWRGRPDGVSGPSRHANIYAVVSGLAQPAQHAAIRAALLDERLKPVGTPYVAGFENIALARLGAGEAFLARVAATWGGMLDRGATTFWEAWDPKQRGDDAYAFYKRPYAKSLCHAWSTGPAAFLPAELLGLRPLADGWARFCVAPRPGLLTWVCATVPTPCGDIGLSVEGRRGMLQVPAGATAIWRDREFSGPGRFELEL